MKRINKLLNKKVNPASEFELAIFTAIGFGIALVIIL
jgi:hypothetical protein